MKDYGKTFDETEMIIYSKNHKGLFYTHKVGDTKPIGRPTKTWQPQKVRAAKEMGLSLIEYARLHLLWDMTKGDIILKRKKTLVSEHLRSLPYQERSFENIYDYDAKVD